MNPWPWNFNAAMFCTGAVLMMLGGMAYGPAAGAIASGFVLIVLNCTSQILETIGRKS